MKMDRGSIYESDVPSLSASLEAFDPERSTHSMYSSTRSGMMASSRWSAQDAELSDAESDGPWAPPAWQRSNNTWFRKSLLGDSALRGSPSKSPGYGSASTYERDVTPSRIPLPDSPLKQTPRTSPEPASEQERYFGTDGIGSRLQSPMDESHTASGAQQGEESIALSVQDDASSAMDGCRCLPSMDW